MPGQGTASGWHQAGPAWAVSVGRANERLLAAAAPFPSRGTGGGDVAQEGTDLLPLSVSRPSVSLFFVPALELLLGNDNMMEEGQQFLPRRSSCSLG